MEEEAGRHTLPLPPPPSPPAASALARCPTWIAGSPMGLESCMLDVGGPQVGRTASRVCCCCCCCGEEALEECGSWPKERESWGAVADRGGGLLQQEEGPVCGGGGGPR